MLTILKFGADWCSGCKIMTPILKDVIDKNPEVGFKDIDVENDEDNLSAKYGIKSLPTLIFESDDKEFEYKLVGTVPASKIQSVINDYNKLT